MSDTPPEGYQRKLMVGMAQILHDAGLGDYTAMGVYSSSQTGIYLRTMPESIGRGIALSTYAVSDDPSLSDSEVGLQVLTKVADPDPSKVDDLDDAIFSFLHGRVDLELPTGLRVVQCLRRSSASLGQSGSNKGWTRSTNYYLSVHVPSDNRS